jgi:uncharacterized membrane protein affecting hemolysin expression
LSFGSFIRSAFHVTQTVVEAAAPFAPLIPPPAGTIISAIVAAEHLLQNPGAGAVKKQLVTNVANNVVPGMDQKVLSESIDQLVAILNKLNSEKKP